MQSREEQRRYELIALDMTNQALRSTPLPVTPHELIDLTADVLWSNFETNTITIDDATLIWSAIRKLYE